MVKLKVTVGWAQPVNPTPTPFCSHPSELACKSLSDIPYCVQAVLYFLTMKTMEREKVLWREILETYREMTFLWDPKDKNYQSKPKRIEGYELLLQRYLEIDPDATIAIFKKRLENMRTAYNREKKKVRKAIENGDSPYIPSLWYYDILSFLEETDSSQLLPVKNENRETFRFNFNRTKNKIYLEKNSSNGLKRKRESFSSTSREDRKPGYINIEPMQFSDEDTSPPPQPSQPKRRIYELLQKQEKFIDTASRLLNKKEKDWEVIGKAIGLQLSSLVGMQQTIAQKLISDAIFYGNIGKLTMDSFVNVDMFEQRSPRSEVELSDDHIVYIEQPSP